MKRFLIGITVLLFGIIACLNVAFAALADVNTSIGSDDVREINNMTPGSNKTFLGTRLQGPLKQGATTYAAGANGNPVGQSGSTPLSAATPTTTVFLKTTGAAGTFPGSESYRLGDGQAGQRLTAVLITDGGGDFTITPVTKSGFTSVKLDDAKDTVSLKFIDTTTGWIIDANNGATIN